MSKPKKSSDSTGIDFNALIGAIKRCITDKQSIKSTAKTFGYPRSSLQRYVQKVRAKFNDLSSIEDSLLLEFVRDCNQRAPLQMVFTLDQERDLVQYILKFVNHYNGLSIRELKELVFQFATKLQLEYPSSWDKDQKAGDHWYYRFKRRHTQLDLRTPEQTSKASTSRAMSASWSDLLDDSIRASSASRLSLLVEIGPTQGTTSKPNPTTAKRASKSFPKKSPQKKRGRPSKPKASSSSEDDEDIDFCLICMVHLPKKLTAANSMHCNVCAGITERKTLFKSELFT